MLLEPFLLFFLFYFFIVVNFQCWPCSAEALWQANYLLRLCVLVRQLQMYLCHNGCGGSDGDGCVMVAGSGAAA